MVGTEEQRGGDRGNTARAAILAAVCAGALLQAAPQQAVELESNFLVVPSRPMASGALPMPSDLRALVGPAPYQVRSVTPASNWSGLKIEIVFDLASTAPEDRACMLEQARAVWREFRGTPGLEVLIVPTSWSDAHGNLGQFADRAYQFFAPGMLPEKTCSPYTRAERVWGHKGRLWDDSSIESFRGLATELERGHGPVVVIWIGQTFSWFHAWGWQGFSVDAGGLVSEHGRGSESAAYPWLDGLTEAGVDIFPVVWLNGRLPQDAGPQESVRNASEIAASLGGQVQVCDADLAPGVRKILERCANGWVVNVAGPAVAWKADGSAETLEVWLEPDRGALDLKRHFVRLEKSHPTVGLRSGYQMLQPLVPLFDTEWLRGHAGCSTVPEAAGTRWTMTALAPETIGQRARGLPTLVEFLPRREAAGEQLGPEEAYLNFKSRKPTQPATGGPKGFTEVCINLPPTTAAEGNYRVFVFDPETKWSAVGMLPLADVLRYQQEHGLRAGGQR